MNLLLSQVAAKLWYVDSMQTQCSTSHATVTPLSLWHQIRSASPISSYKFNPVVPNSVGHSWSLPSHKLRLSASHFSQAFWDLQTKQILLLWLKWELFYIDSWTWTFDPQLVVLFMKITDPLRDGVLLEEGRTSPRVEVKTYDWTLLPSSPLCLLCVDEVWDLCFWLPGWPCTPSASTSPLRQTGTTSQNKSILS